MALDINCALLRPCELSNSITFLWHGSAGLNCMVNLQISFFSDIFHHPWALYSNSYPFVLADISSINIGQPILSDASMYFFKRIEPPPTNTAFPVRKSIISSLNLFIRSFINSSACARTISAMFSSYTLGFQKCFILIKYGFNTHYSTKIYINYAIAYNINYSVFK